jgi:hypothetical protein
VELDPTNRVRPRAHRGSAEPRERRARRSADSIPTCHSSTSAKWISGSPGRWPRRVSTRCCSVLGGIGLLLAAGGIYGVIAYFVTQRTQEIGVRIALGATPASVVRMILGQAMRPVALGTLVGVGGALAASRVLSGQLFGVTRTDPLTMAAVVATLIGVALVASVVPARRAAAVDPTRALQSE